MNVGRAWWWGMACLVAVCLSGCSLLEKVPPVEVCVVYKGKQICARKVNGVWSFSAGLSAEERAEIVKDIDGE